MKSKIRLEIVELAKQLSAEDKSFDASIAKKRVSELLEKLTILSYLEGQINQKSPEPPVETPIQSQSLDSKSFREENWFKEPEPLPESSNKEELVEPVIEKIKDLVAQMPQESQQVDELLEDVLPPKKLVKNDLEEFASTYQQTPTFERKEKETPKAPTNSTLEGKPKSINDTVNKGLQIGLNDRLAFVKHLFNDSIEDYTRVLSQINTMDTFNQASEFIKGQVKPDYNYWLKKEEYSERFMQIIEKSFN